ncbi:bifunctional peptidase and arginyl-hydroxylase JMJD5-like isoform X2 [Corticium candelabrum]|uniref:bifunctional peptidase and arginyl-hydroxylase JMJD5-like isoform X2 n=1 Tax=Corticium candelabrum TaxID=121492 RepID=UPI002E25633C|nr:bifunctional peptidase and arginyl-hydroxylase JMJD5-like isoform X2 [Corticium candelabrum]
MQLLASLVFLTRISFFAGQSYVDPTTLRGHLQPLGSQGPQHPVTTLSHFPDPETFHMSYTRRSRPLLVKGAAKESPAFSLWTDDYFLTREESDHVTVTVEYGKKENRSQLGSTYTMKSFIEAYKSRDIYLVTGVPRYIMPDILLPSALLCGGFQNQLIDGVMWFSSGGTKSVLHNDDVDNINCLFSGVKELFFVEYPKYKEQVNLDHTSGSYSSVDVDSVDLSKYPGFKDVEFYFARMEAGDCLYIPYKWYHQVRSYDRNIAVNVWWNPLIEFNTSDCDSKDAKVEGFPTFDKYKFAVLDSENGDEDNEVGPSPSVDIKNYFHSLMKKDHSMTLLQLIEKLQQDKLVISPGLKWVPRMNELSKKIFVLLDVDLDSLITEEDFNAIDDKCSRISYGQTSMPGWK